MTGYIFLLITIILFSSMEVAGRLIHLAVPPLSMTFLRFFIGFLVILPFIIFNKREMSVVKAMKRADILKIFLLGFTNVFLSMMLLQLAVHRGNASIPAILISSNPLFVYIITAFMTKSVSKSHVIKIISGLFGISGIIIFSQSESFKNPFLALSLSVLASILFAAYTIGAHGMVEKFSNLTVTGLSFLFGSVLYLPFIFAFEDYAFILRLSAKEIYVLLYMGVFITGLGYVFFFEGLKRMKVYVGSMVFFLKPLFALLFSFIFLNERFIPLQIFFVLFILYSTLPEIRKKNVHGS